MKNKKRVLAGMRPSNFLHIGNYYGGGKGMVELQNDEKFETLYMVADLHAITTPHDPKKLPIATKNVILDYLAFGLDPKKSIIFVQSDLADLHAQLAFYFASSVSIARMQHLPTYKEKIKDFPGISTMALLNYPVLMAADILIYKAHKVPVGIDQEPHLEVAREIARKMNAQYGIDFPEPTRFKTKGEYIPSLTGEGKMSKSVEGSYIGLTDSLEEIRKKLAKAPTDSGKGSIKLIEKTKTHAASNMIVSEAGTEARGVDALFKLVDLFQGVEKRNEHMENYVSTGIKYSELKTNLAQAIYDELKPIQKKRAELEKDPAYIEKILKEGAIRARQIATKTVNEVKTKMGLS